MRRGGGGSGGFAAAWMGAALSFLLLQIPVWALAAIAGLLAYYVLGWPPGRAQLVGYLAGAVLDLVAAVWMMRMTGLAPGAREVGEDPRDGSKEGRPAAPEDAEDDGELLRFERGLLVGSTIVAVASLLLNGTRPGWEIAIGVTDALGAILLAVGALAVSLRDRHVHVRAWLATLLLAASAAWTFGRR